MSRHPVAHFLCNGWENRWQPFIILLDLVLFLPGFQKGSEKDYRNYRHDNIAISRTESTPANLEERAQTQEAMKLGPPFRVSPLDSILG